MADTNLIVYLLVEAEQTGAAKACGTRDPIWVAPAIWRHELMNVLSLYIRTRNLPVEEALRALKLADELVETITNPDFDRHVLRLASERKMASYDAEFLVAAQIANVRLVTADASLIRHSEGRAISIQDFAAGL